MLKATVAAASSLLLFACGPDLATVGDSSADGTTDAMGSQQELGATHTYKCRQSTGTGNPNLFTLKIGATSTTLTAIDPGYSGVAGAYSRNANYQPTNPRYTGWAQYKRPTTYTMSLLMEEPLRHGGVALHSGGHGGFATLEGPYISHSMINVFCSR